MNSFFGGQPAAILLRLAVISLLVGFILSVLGLSPFDIVDSFFWMIERIYDLGFEAFEWLLRYFLLGAVIVFPVWLAVRVWKSMSRNSSATRRDA